MALDETLQTARGPSLDNVRLAIAAGAMLDVDRKLLAGLTGFQSSMELSAGSHPMAGPPLMMDNFRRHRVALQAIAAVGVEIEIQRRASYREAIYQFLCSMARHRITIGTDSAPSAVHKSRVILQLLPWPRIGFELRSRASGVVVDDKILVVGNWSSPTVAESHVIPVETPRADGSICNCSHGIRDCGGLLADGYIPIRIILEDEGSAIVQVEHSGHQELACPFNQTRYAS